MSLYRLKNINVCVVNILYYRYFQNVSNLGRPVQIARRALIGCRLEIPDIICYLTYDYVLHNTDIVP